MSDHQTPEPPTPAPFEDKPIGDDEGGLIGLSIRRPVGVLVGIILVVLFGGLSVFGLPIQLTPDISVPTLTVTTVWPGASPSEIEREILLEQEEVLKSVVGLDRLTSESTTGSATVTLEMDVGTSIDEADPHAQPQGQADDHHHGEQRQASLGRARRAVHRRPRRGREPHLG